MLTTRAADILIVDDEIQDVELVRQALHCSPAAHRIHHAADGLEALRFLRNEAPFEQAARPDLVLLDLHMPIMGGAQALGEIRKDPRLCTIPVVVMTSSDRSEDVAMCYSLRANCYVQKPCELSAFSRSVLSIESFWLSTVTLPSVMGRPMRSYAPESS